MYSFPNLEPVYCSMSSSNCCFLTSIQISQEAGQVVWYSHPFQNFPVCCDPHSQRLSVQFSHWVMSDSLRPHDLQHARPPCPSPTPGVHPNSCALSQWCHLAISSCHPLLLLPPIPPSIRVFSNESTLRMRWPKYWSFSFSIIPSKEHPGLISGLDWLDLLTVQGILKSLLQHHSSKASILRCSAFFTVQLSYIHTWPLEKP